MIDEPVVSIVYTIPREEMLGSGICEGRASRRRWVNNQNVEHD
jgi:hypothetical protein